MAVLKQSFQNLSNPVLIGLGIALVAAAAPLAWGSPWAPMLVGAALCAGCAGIYLLQRPAQALYLALFLLLLPNSLRIDPIYTVGSNLAVALALFGWGIRWLLGGERIRWNVTWILLAAYILLGIVTLLWAPDLIEGRRKAVAYTIGFIVIFLIVHQVRTLRAVDGFMTSLRGIGWVIVAGGVFEIVSGGYQPGQRISIFDINQNQLVMIMLLLVPSFAWPVLRSSGTRRRVHLVLNVIFILSTFIFIALSGSRGGAVSLAVLMTASLFSRQVRPWAVLSAVLVAGLVVTTPSVIETLNQRFEEQEGGNFGGRDLLWETGILLIKDHPWSGVGLGGGPLELPKYISIVTGDAFLNSKRSFPSHNPFLEVGADTGVFGMMLYMAMVLSVLWQSVTGRSGATGPIMHFYRPLILIIAAAYSLSWIKSGGVENHPTFFILLGMLLLPAIVQDDIRPEESL